MKKHYFFILILGTIGLIQLSTYFLFDAVPAVLFIILISLFWIIKKSKKKAMRKELPHLTQEKETHYEELGMSNQEIIFFRKIMQETQQQILLLEENIKQSAKLKASNLRNDTLDISKEIFKELVKKPQKLHSASQFLYTDLPNLTELTTRYLALDTKKIKTKEIYDKLTETHAVIDQVSQSVKQMYETIVADDLADLDIKLSIAKNKLTMDNEEI